MEDYTSECLWWHGIPVEGENLSKRFSHRNISVGSRDIVSQVAKRDVKAFELLDEAITILRELDPSEEEVSYWISLLPERYEDVIRCHLLNWIWQRSRHTLLPSWVTIFEEAEVASYIDCHRLTFVHFARVDAAKRGMSIRKYYGMLATHDSYLKCAVKMGSVSFIQSTISDCDVSYSSTLDMLYKKMDDAVGQNTTKSVNTLHTFERDMALCILGGDYVPRGSFLAVAVAELIKYCHREVYEMDIGDDCMSISDAVQGTMRLAKWHLTRNTYTFAFNYHKCYTGLVESRIASTIVPKEKKCCIIS